MTARRFVTQRFNPPPSWPVTPDDDWRPPPGWEPDPGWPDPPSGWDFWLGWHGQPSSGPIGAYGAVNAGRVDLAVTDPALVLMHS